ncbi:MAG: multiheme c-type cytochrome [Candidatus Rokuibacteriota bacterium]
MTPRVRVVAGAIVLAVLGAPASARDSTSDFSTRHWRQPLAAQGTPPASFSPLERSLNPESCGTCHPLQYGDWRGSIHAAASGPGIAGQLVEMWSSDPASASGCYACHAPLAEQRLFIRTGTGFEKNIDYDAALADKGVPCAACHVRGHERFGPPRRDGSLGSRAARETLPHRGVTRTAAFLASEFCRGCHQFAPNGPAINGKLLQDTYVEWQASPFGRRGVQCQDCHMPARRHQWRGIHDPDMVRSGLTITARADAARYRPGDWASLVLTVTSTRVGHAFPTYVTPRVIMRVELLEGDGRPVPGTRVEKIIAREISLDLSRELFDTRLRPGQRATLAYRPRLATPGLRARFSVVVEPDAFYERFFEVLLRQGTGRGEGQIREALEAARRSPFTVFAQDIPLT